MKKFTDVIIYPEYDTDEISFETSSPRYYVDCSCPNCKKIFRLALEFEHNITKHRVRK